MARIIMAIYLVSGIFEVIQQVTWDVERSSQNSIDCFDKENFMIEMIDLFILQGSSRGTCVWAFQIYHDHVL